MKKDFFSRYRESRKYQYIIPAIFALALSVTAVANYHGDLGNLKTLSASVVAGVASDKKYDADLLIERNGSDIIIRMGKTAERVDTLTVTLLGDPTLFTGLTTDDPTLSITTKDPGMYVVRAGIGEQTLHAGDMVIGLRATLDPKGTVAPVDATFMSAGVEYGLSVKGE